jgi:hypothetical protein
MQKIYEITINIFSLKGLIKPLHRKVDYLNDTYTEI